ncbi:MAG: hypothetical protein AB8H86_31920 [Polyangiales bacterium]
MRRYLFSYFCCSLLASCSVWADGDYEFVDSECRQDLECAAAAFATPTCSAGRCVLTCDDTHVDCNDDYSDGCESALDDLESCGGCGVVCEASSGNMAMCVDGECGVICNAAEFLDCDMDAANGCEVDGTTLANCGGCGVRCADGEFCRGDGETYACAITCDETDCGGTCVDTTINRLHCGRCGNLCSNENTDTPSTCGGGECVLDCSDGFENCDMNPQNGCETETNTSTNCGACGVGCGLDNATGVCDLDGAFPECAIGACNEGYLDCNAETSDGCEVDRTSDANHCGACNFQCPDGICTNGVCDPVIDVASSFDHSCAVRLSGAVYCTGADSYGANGGLADPALEPRRVLLADGNPLVANAISVGENHSCAIDASGHLLCWGRRTDQRVGQTSTTGNSEAPAPVEAAAGEVMDFGLRTFTEVRTALRHSCALDDLGGVWCFGAGDRGGLGGGNESDSLARRVALPAAARTVVVGLFTSAAILTDGRVYGFGVNDYGQLGIDPTVEDMVLSPRELLGGGLVRDFALGGSSACFLGMDDVVRCMGRNTDTRLGSEGEDSHVPRAVDLPFTALSISATTASACARSSSTIYCWGHNDDGEAGSGAFSPSSLPVEVVFPEGVVPDALLRDGYYNVCALANGVPYCWGSNKNDNLSVNLDDWRELSRPEAVDGSPLPLVNVSVAGEHGCGATSDALYCWGTPPETLRSSSSDRAFYHEPLEVVLPSGVTSVLSIAAGDNHTCFVGNDGVVYCGGDNGSGELGAVSGVRNTPIAAGLPAGMEEVSAATNATCARRGGEVYCFGESAFHPSSAGRNEDRVSGGASLTTPVPGLSDAAHIASGHAFSCALREGGAVQCWGFDQLGQRGDGDDEDGIVNLPEPARDIGLGFAHACAVLMSGRVMCWGNSNFGRLGNNVTSGTFVDPVYVVDGAGMPITGMMMVGVNEATSCAVGVDNTVMCWGDSRHGELGTFVSSPVAVLRPDINDALSVHGGSYVRASTLCFMRSGADGDGTVGCIGNRNAGRIGGARALPRVAAPMRYRGLPGLPGD